MNGYFNKNSQEVVAIETHGRDSRWTISGDITQTLSAAAGTGGVTYQWLLKTKSLSTR